MKLPDLIGHGWGSALADAEEMRAKAWQRIQPDMRQLAPKPEDVFRAFTYPIADVRVVILGQDPYPTPGLATGLAFAVPQGTQKVPPSLRAIMSELAADAKEQGWATAAATENNAQRTTLTNPNLESWATQGVLLLNTVLTCRESQSMSHEHVGWQAFTSQVLDALCRRSVPPVAVLWGRQAQKAGIHRTWSHIVSSSHPSPLSAHKGFYGSRPFSKVNAALTSLGQMPIDWLCAR